MTVDVEHPTLGPLRTLGTPIKMSATPLNPKRRAPMLGEHTDDVLIEAGYSSDEIEQLRFLGRRRAECSLRLIGHRVHSRGSHPCDHEFHQCFSTLPLTFDPASDLHSES